MALVSRMLSALALTGTALVACGSRSALDVLGAPGIVVAPGDDAGSDAGLDAAPPGDESMPCVGRPIELTLVAPNLYFVLDHSTSMKQMAKWSNVRQVVAQVITQIGAGARFGATLFPGSVDQCSLGVEVMSLRQGDAQGVVAGTFLAATTAAPDGGTPTAATLDHLVPTLSGLEGTTFAILATDGGPNCNASLSCPADQCTGNIDGVPNCPPNCCDPVMGGNPQSCLDDVAAVQAASDLAAAGVETFVLGIPGSAPYGPILDRLAIAGGTARSTEPRYYDVGTADTAALTAALAQIVARTGAGCTFTLANPPSASQGMRVLLNGTVIPSTGPDRWTLAGTTLTLHGASCASVQSAGAPSLQFFDGCP
jgi:hypothetical protein